MRGIQGIQIQESHSSKLQKLVVTHPVQYCHLNANFSSAIVHDHPLKAAQVSSSNLASSIIQSLLDEYADLFLEPTTLPPQREHDHRILLKPDAKPVNVRPYKHSPI